MTKKAGWMTPYFIYGALALQSAVGYRISDECEESKRKGDCQFNIYSIEGILRHESALYQSNGATYLQLVMQLNNGRVMTLHSTADDARAISQNVNENDRLTFNVKKYSCNSCFYDPSKVEFPDLKMVNGMRFNP